MVGNPYKMRIFSKKNKHHIMIFTQRHKNMFETAAHNVGINV